MIKVFNDAQEYNSYVQGGLTAGDLYYVLDDGSVHFRTNNIDGEDKVYDKGDGGSDEPEYIALNLNTFTYMGDWYKFIKGIEAVKGKSIEVYNPNHFDIVVGLGDLNPHPATGEMVGPFINRIFLSSKQNDNTYVEHLYLTNADYDNYETALPYFVIELNSQAGTPTDGIIYYRIF